MLKEINKLYFDDCINILKRLPDNSIDLFLQDPPFEVTDQDWDTGFIEKLPVLWELWLQKAKDNTPFIFKATFPFANDLINSRPKGMKYYEWAWVKDRFTNFVNVSFMPLRCFEYLFVFYRQNNYTYNPVLRKTKNPEKRIRKRNGTAGSVYKVKSENYESKISEFGFPINLIQVPSEKEAFISTNGSQNRHPNRTNPEVWKYLIKTYTNENDLIFDGYAGSGSIEQAAIELNRNYIACENSPDYFFDTEKRLFDTKEKKLFGYDKTNLTTNVNSLFFASQM